MAEVQLKRSDASLWRVHYTQWRDRFGIDSVYIRNLQDIIILATRSGGLAMEQREALGLLIRDIDDERCAFVKAGESH